MIEIEAKSLSLGTGNSSLKSCIGKASNDGAVGYFYDNQKVVFLIDVGMEVTCVLGIRPIDYLRAFAFEICEVF